MSDGGSEDFDYGSEDAEVEFESDDEEADECMKTATQDNARYRVVTAETVAQLQAEAIDRAKTTLFCSSSEAAIVLRHYRWNFDALMEAMAEMDRDVVFQRAGATGSNRSNIPDMVSDEVCMVCGCTDLTQPGAALTMDCGHTFCKECWLHHVQVKISEGDACTVPCMAFKCGAICNQKAVEGLLKEADPAALAKYEHALVNSYIEDNENVKWCTSVPCCGRAIEVLEDSYCEPKCACGHSFCFKCGDRAHSPCTCDMWRRWQQKQKDESETEHYMNAHTKPCPKCGVRVDKDGGCNLVVCRSCRQPFCWLCGAKTGLDHTWTQIEGHTCGEWKAASDAAIADNKAKLERYLHYHSHYQGHLDSMKKETYGPSLDRLLRRLAEYLPGGIDWGYLQHANAVLLECRRVLSNAYAFSFFMFDPAEFTQDMTADENRRLQCLFEEGVKVLKETVEALSQLLQDDVKLLQNLVHEEEEEEEPPAIPFTAAGGRSVPRPPTDVISIKHKVESFDAKASDERRLRMINYAVNLDKQIRNMFHLIERDILVKVCSQNMQIAPYDPVFTAASVCKYPSPAC